MITPTLKSSPPKKGNLQLLITLVASCLMMNSVIKIRARSLEVCINIKQKIFWKLMAWIDKKVSKTVKIRNKMWTNWFHNKQQLWIFHPPPGITKSKKPQVATSLDPWTVTQVSTSPNQTTAHSIWKKKPPSCSWTRHPAPSDSKEASKFKKDSTESHSKWNYQRNYRALSLTLKSPWRTN